MAIPRACVLRPSVAAVVRAAEDVAVASRPLVVVLGSPAHLADELAAARERGLRVVVGERAIGHRTNDDQADE